MSLSEKQIRNLKALLKGESIAWTSLCKDIRQTLIDEEQISIVTHGSNKSLYAQSPDNLRMFLEQYYEVLRGFDWDSEDLSIASSRANLAVNSGNSKTKAIRTCPGFLVNCYTPIPAKLNSNNFFISPEDGTMLFVSDWKHRQ